MWQWLRQLCRKSVPQRILKNRSILIVEDGEGERRFYSRTLEKAGYDVDTASDAFQAMKKIDKKMPDLILTDVVMPGMDGKEMCLRLKSDERTAHIPVVFLTGSVKGGEVVDCFGVGAEYYLEKPIDARGLVHQIDMVLSDLEQEAAVS
ncbi:MAG: response regulator [Candidatus Omnitrophota bacterium]